MESAGKDRVPALCSYYTQLNRGRTHANPVDVPSAVWSPDGKKIGAILNGFVPVIYGIDDPEPVLVLKSTVDLAEPLHPHSYRSISTYDNYPSLPSYVP